MENLKFSIVLFFASILLFQSCKNRDDDGGGSDPCSSSFDQVAMFTNLADNIIIPSYQNLQDKVNAMSDATNTFVGEVNDQNLTALRSTWLDAYVAWQGAAQFEMGPAEEVFLRNSVNNFPVSTGMVDMNITSGVYDFDQPDEFDKGFPAIDYLLYGLGDDAMVLNLFSTDEKFRDYLTALVTDIKERVDHTFNGWKNGYRETFIQNTGTAAGTSLSLIINNLNENYELIKREKIGVPSGVLSLGFINPTKVEAFYSGHSVQLAIAALQATERLYLGTSLDGVNGLSLDDFLAQINARKNDNSLDGIIQQQFSKTISAVSALPDPLAETIEGEVSIVVDAYNEIANQVINIKTDLPSVLCVSITYIDNPSDSD